jgi:signal transduction histidine kinase/CheY-like chemotaxis protein
MLSQAMMNISDSVFIADSSGALVFVNSAYCNAYGYSEQEVLGLPATMVGDVTTAGEFVHRRKDGTTVIVLVSVSAIHDERGYPFATVGVSRDISFQRAAELELRKAKEIAESAAQAKSDFLAAMSHEIRTPLNGVIGMTDLLLDSELSYEQRERLSVIRSSGETLLTVINEVLDFSKIEAGRLELERIGFDVRATVEQSAELMAESAHRKGLALLVHVDQHVPRQMLGDAARIRQVLLNFISNAIKFTDRGEVVVKVAMQSGPSVHTCLHFAVTDTGIGIPEHQHSRMFNTFSQADSSTTRKFGGTGLGLAISKRLAALMGGEVGFSSKAGEGSTFWFTVSAEQTQDRGEVRFESVADLKGRRVLVAADNASSRAILRSALEALGVGVDEVSAAREVLARMRSATGGGEPYHVVIIDADMPDVNGLIVSKAAGGSEIALTVPLILMTSSTQRAQIEVPGVVSFVKKPVGQQRIGDCILDTLGLRKQQQPSPQAVPQKASYPADWATILLAEDNPVNQKVAQPMLRRLGCAVHTVANGVDAVNACLISSFDLVLMDIQMPEMDGFTATWHIRQLPGARIPIVALTANALSGEREKCLRAGMDDYLAKPIRSESLEKAIRRWIPLPAARNARVPR